MSENTNNTSARLFIGPSIIEAGIRHVSMIPYDEDGMLDENRPLQFTPRELHSVQEGDGFVETFEGGKIRGIVTVHIRKGFTPPPPPAVGALSDWSKLDTQKESVTLYQTFAVDLEAKFLTRDEAAEVVYPTHLERLQAMAEDELVTAEEFNAEVETAESTQKLDEWLHLKDKEHEERKRARFMAAYGGGGYSEAEYRALMYGTFDPQEYQGADRVHRLKGGTPVQHVEITIDNNIDPRAFRINKESIREAMGKASPLTATQKQAEDPFCDDRYHTSRPLYKADGSPVDSSPSLKDCKGKFDDKTFWGPFPPPFPPIPQAHELPKPGAEHVASVPEGFASQVLDTVCKRGDSYGKPGENHQLTADLWSMWLSRRLRQEVRFTPEDVCMLNILQKQSRLAFTTKDDSWLDVAGYAENVAMLSKEQRNERR